MQICTAEALVCSTEERGVDCLAASLTQLLKLGNNQQKGADIQLPIPECTETYLFKKTFSFPRVRFSVYVEMYGVVSIYAFTPYT